MRMRNRIAIALLGSLSILLVVVETTCAFSIAVSTIYPLDVRRNHRSRVNPLHYRELDDDDDDTTMLKVQTRAPPGFDMKDNLANRGTNSAMNVPLIKALLLNQAFILLAVSIVLSATFLATDGFHGFAHVQEILHWGGKGGIDLTLSPLRLAIGVLGALPIIAFGNLIENSDNRAFANINFSTITMVLTLFGRRKVPPPDFIPKRLQGTTMSTTSTTDAMLQSVILASVTGICEEIIFRMEIPALLSHYFGGYPILPLIGQAFLFGFGHSQPSTGLAENIIVISLQITNGLLFGLLYLLSGYDLVPCIVAHAVYDFSVFFKTWIDANDQLEYAEVMYAKALPSKLQLDVDNVLQSSGANIDPRTLNVIKRLFYTFDFDKNKSLSRSEVRKGLSYLALEKAGTPPPQDQVDILFNTYASEAEKSRLSFADFLRLYIQSGAFKTRS